MITRALWLALRYPPLKDPQYVRILTQTRNPPPLIVVLLGVMLGPLWLVILIFASVQYGLVWITQINAAIARERENRTYDLLCLCPHGPFGVHWAIAAATLNRNGVFARLTNPIFLLIRIALAILLVLAVLNVSSQGLALLPLHLTIAGVLTLMQYQSPVLAVLIAVHPSSTASTPLVAQLSGGAIYLALENGFLLLMVSAIVGLNALVAGGAAQATTQETLGLALIAVAVYGLVREVAILFLWRSTLHALDGLADHPRWLNWRDHIPHRPRQRTVQLDYHDP